MRRALVAAILAAGLLAIGSSPSSAQGEEDVQIVIQPEVVDLRLGEAAEVAVTVTNNGTEPTDPLVVHIDITDPSQSGSVDPEDWTATLSREAGIIEPGASRTLTWDLRPIGSGRFTVYAVTLTEGSPTVHASEGMVFAVEHHRSLNPEGVLPVAIGAPLVVALALGAQWWNSRRRMKPVPA